MQFKENTENTNGMLQLFIILEILKSRKKEKKNDVWFSRFHCWAFELTSHYFKLFDGGNKDEIKGHFKIKFNDKKNLFNDNEKFHSIGFE